MNNITPNFFIVGAPRAGTTALQKLLSSHPDVFMSPIKEPHYFSKDFEIENFSTDYRKKALCDLSNYLEKPILQNLHLAHTPNYQQYIQLYRDVRGQKAIGEASSGYLYSSVAAENIKKTNPHARIIMILRNPVDRAYSHFIMDKASGRVRESSFVKAVEKDLMKPTKAWGGKHLYVELGLYYEQVRRYQKAFPPNQIKIILYDDWINNNAQILVEICRFLEIPTGGCYGAGTILNKSQFPRFHYLHYFLTIIKLRHLQNKLLPEHIRNHIKKKWYILPNETYLPDKDKQKISNLFNNDKNNLRLLLGKKDLWL